MSKDQDDLSAAFTHNMEISEEETHQYLACLGNIAHRYPINRAYWDLMADISIEGAALYSFGIDPGAIQSEWSDPENSDLDQLPTDYRERLSIIKSAVRAGIIKRLPAGREGGNDCDEDTRILMSSFKEWYETIKDSWLPAEAIPAYPDLQPAVKTEPSTPAGDNESTHDPLPIDGIAQMFHLDKDEAKNIKIWRDLAHNAIRKKLSSARALKGSGHAQSLFDPVKVGDWLVAKGKFTKERVDRILSNNLPDRSAHLKDLLAP